MNGGKKPLGYTIIEVMIVLAVSGVMFLIASTFINGKQARTAFTAGVNEMASQIQDMINQVQSGKYSDIPLDCTSVSGNITVNSGGSVDTQGTQAGCVFLGKVMHFSVAGNGSDYEVLSLAGSRLDNSGKVSTTLSSAKTVKDLRATASVPQSLEITNIANAPNTNSLLSFAIGFLQDPVACDDPAACTVKLASAAQSVSLYYVTGVNKNTSAYTTSVAVTVQKTDYASLCVTDNTRYAEITLGDNGNQMNVKVKMLGTSKGTGACS